MTEPKPTRTYFAKSIFTSKSAQVGFFSGALEIVNLIFPLYPDFFSAEIRVMVLGIITIVLRRLTERPARFISPGETEPVEVTTLTPAKE